ncbi:hypothetical protein [Bacillus altitudinis]
MDIIIRYVFKHRFSGNIEIKKYSTSQLEAQAAKNCRRASMKLNTK